MVHSQNQINRFHGASTSCKHLWPSLPAHGLRLPLECGLRLSKVFPYRSRNHFLESWCCALKGSELELPQWSLWNRISAPLCLNYLGLWLPVGCPKALRSQPCQSPNTSGAWTTSSYKIGEAHYFLLSHRKFQCLCIREFDRSGSCAPPDLTTLCRVRAGMGLSLLPWCWRMLQTSQLEIGLSRKGLHLASNNSRSWPKLRSCLRRNLCQGWALRRWTGYLQKDQSWCRYTFPFLLNSFLFSSCQTASQQCFSLPRSRLSLSLTEWRSIQVLTLSFWHLFKSLPFGLNPWKARTTSSGIWRQCRQEFH